jgi:hypothetical protein
VTIEDLINLEVDLYVQYCRAAAQHDEWEQYHRMAAHTLFYHIQEMRCAKNQTSSVRFLSNKTTKAGPIS